MNTAANIVALILVAIVWNQYRNGTLRQWIRAKFLNKTS